MNTTTLTLPTERAASGLAYAYLRLQEAERPIDRKVAVAEFLGMCKAIANLGFAMTEASVHMDVMDAYNATAVDGPRPAFRAMGNHAQVAWDSFFIERVETRVFG